jgi:hypothetical protein
LANTEREIADKTLSGSGLSAARLGLRFDRVVVRVLGELRSFAEGATPGGVTILVTISAPIRLPAKTVEDLKREIGALQSVGAPHADHSAMVQGNHVRMRTVRQSSRPALALIGFVHNPTSAPELLLDLAEQWLHAQDQASCERRV